MGLSFEINFVSSETHRVSFNDEIRPVLSDKCYACHGPAKKQLRANLRLDVKESAFAQWDGSPAIVPGKLLDSTLYQRVTAEDPKDRMSLAYWERSLNQHQIDLFVGLNPGQNGRNTGLLFLYSS